MTHLADDLNFASLHKFVSIILNLETKYKHKCLFESLTHAALAMVLTYNLEHSDAICNNVRVKSHVVWFDVSLYQTNRSHFNQIGSSLIQRTNRLIGQNSSFCLLI